MRTIIAPVLCLAFAISLTLPDAPQAAIGADLDARKKINLSGRQRMLTQRMAKSACFVFQGVDQDSNMASLTAAHKAFSDTHTSLKKGGGTHSLRLETNDSILASLSEVEALWHDYSQAITDFEASRSSDALHTIAWMNVPTLIKMNEAVGVIAQQYAAGVIDPALATTINVAGRQRMLTQRAAKELCFLAAGINSDQSRESLSRTVELFDRSLVALMNGDDTLGVVPPIIDDLAWQLEAVQALWEEMKPVFMNAATTGVVSDEDLQFIAAKNDQLLKQCNDAVWFYSNY